MSGNPFERLVRPVTSAPKAVKGSYELCMGFVRSLVFAGCRLSYTGLHNAAVQLGELSKAAPIPGQRGASIAKQLPVELQPFICRNDGGYHPKVRSTFRAVRADLEALPVIPVEAVPQALQVWREQLAEAASRLASEGESESEG